MLARLRARLTYANVVASLALFAALGGGAFAATKFVGDDGRIHACVGKKGQIKLLKTGKQCSKKKTPIAWSQRGPTGPQGLQGDKGEPATRLWAVINGSGNTVRGSGVVSSASVSVNGTYEVIFNRDVTACSYAATIGDPGGGEAAAGMIATASREGEPNGVYIATFDTSGAPAARPFHLQVFC